MEHTQNYQLSQWSRTDQVKMDDFNADNAKIDAALKAEADARTAETAALAAEVSKLGNCSVGTFTYTGTGTHGADGPTVIPFPKVPLFAVVRGGSDEIMFIHTNQLPPILDNNRSGFLTASYHWTGSTLYLYHFSDVRFQCNTKGVVYYVVAFYAEDEEG